MALVDVRGNAALRYPKRLYIYKMYYVFTYSSEWTALITLWQTIGSRSLGKQGGCVKLGKENGESTHTPEEDVSDESPSLCCDSVPDVATGSSA